MPALRILKVPCSPAAAKSIFCSRFPISQSPLPSFGIHPKTCYFGSRGQASEAMKTAGATLLLSICLVLCARADLTIVQKIEGAGQNGTITIKIKGDKARIDATPKVTTIVDRKTGEVISLMNDRKMVVRISADTMKAAADMINKFGGKKEGAEKPKLTATGKKEVVDGYETEQYVWETPKFKATYWIAFKYPDGAAILKELQELNSQVWKSRSEGMPNYQDFPGLPIKTVISSGGNEVTTTLTAVKRDPLSDSEFMVPKDFREVKMPDMTVPRQKEEETPGAAGSPTP
jgi:hypothetical protein